MDPQLYSPMPMRKQDGSVSVVAGPQVGISPISMALPSRTTSMTSSNPSFYYTPPHPMAGAHGANSSGGPVPATQYVADHSDPIDVMLASAITTLDRAAASKLLLRRIGAGKYEIDGRRVTCRWGDTGGGVQGLLAYEDDVKDVSASEMPLAAYLGQAANVAASLTGHRADMPKIARIPKEQRLTFTDVSKDSTQALKLDDVGNERCESMRIACEQAFLRERAAEAYERRLNNPYAHSQATPPRALQPPAGLAMPYLNN